MFLGGLGYGIEPVMCRVVIHRCDYFLGINIFSSQYFLKSLVGAN